MNNELHNKPYLKPLRQHLRNNATSAEYLLWQVLKGSKLDEKKFRRQQSIGHFIVDFYCPVEKLIIEVDGSVHEVDEIKKYDIEREQQLIELGFKVLRITNDEIFENLDKVIEKTRNTFTTPSPPPPKGGETESSPSFLGSETKLRPSFFQGGSQGVVSMHMLSQPCHINKFLLIAFAFVFLFVTIATAQSYQLEIKPSVNSSILQKINYKKTHATTSDRQKEIEKVLLYLYNNAYLAATIDSVIASDSLKSIAYFNAGEQYKWAQLKKGNVDEGILSSVGFREKIYKGKLLYYKDIAKIQEKLLVYCESNGYPFASVKLDSIVINPNTIAARLNLQKNKQVRIDSIIINGSAKITPLYLYNYLGIKPGNLYNESAIKNVAPRIKELSFISEAKPSSILFSEKNTKLLLYIDKKKASQFDGIIGVLPDNITGKILFTGDVRLNLFNAIHRGEQIEMNWRSLAQNTQDLRAHVNYPFIFSLPFGVDYQFKLYKKDTSFIDINQNIALQYLLIGGNYLKVFFNSKQSSLLSTTNLEFLTVLPPYADISVATYGLGYKKEKLDYRLNPRKGFTLILNGGIGNKTIHKNAKLNPISYQGLSLNSTHYNGDLIGDLFIAIKNKSTIKLGIQAAFLNNKSIFKNELYRIGGLKTLRGFDEESIYASSYIITTVEYRYLMEQNSYLYLFADGAYYENQSLNFTGDKYDNPLGFGAGFSFATKAGIFSINYALGKQLNNPIYFKSGKIHFGIVNYF